MKLFILLHAFILNELFCTSSTKKLLFHNQPVLVFLCSRCQNNMKFQNLYATVKVGLPPFYPFKSLNQIRYVTLILAIMHTSEIKIIMLDPH